MPRFYFHLRDDFDVPDSEGAELPDLDAARERASREARSIISETVASEGRIALHHRIDIEDERGEVVATQRFADAIRIESQDVSGRG